MSDILQVQGINSKGFGMIPKLAMQDRRLTAQAKAIYGYFSSYTGNGSTAFPSVSKIRYDLKISKSAYYTHFNLLKKYGYIKVEQVKGKGGKYFNNVYTLPDSLPCPEKQDTVEKSSPCPNLQYTVQRDTVSRDTEKQDTNINSNKNNSLKNNSPSSQSAPMRPDRKDGQDGTDVSERKIKGYELWMKENIGYEDFRLASPHDIRLVDEIIAIMVDVMATPGATVALDGENKPRELVRRRLMELDHEDITHVLAQFKSLTRPIRRKRRYLLTMLYNSKLELEAHYANQVNSDMNGGGR